MENVRQILFTSVDYIWKVHTKPHKKEIVYFLVVAFILLFVVSSISPGCMGSETSFIFLPPQAPGTLPIFKPHSVQILHLHFPCSESSILPIRDSIEKGGGGRKKEWKKCKFAGHSLKESKRRWVGEKEELHSPYTPVSPLPFFLEILMAQDTVIQSMPCMLLLSFISGPGVRARGRAELERVCWRVWCSCSERSKGFKTIQ